MEKIITSDTNYLGLQSPFTGQIISCESWYDANGEFHTVVGDDHFRWDNAEEGLEYLKGEYQDLIDNYGYVETNWKGI